MRIQLSNPQGGYMWNGYDLCLFFDRIGTCFSNCKVHGNDTRDIVIFLSDDIYYPTIKYNYEVKRSFEYAQEHNIPCYTTCIDNRELCIFELDKHMFPIYGTRNNLFQINSDSVIYETE